MDNAVFCDKKYLVTNTIQELYDEYNRLQEVHNQFKCENELGKKYFILTIKKQEDEIKLRDTRVNVLEGDLSKKNIQINDYETMIRELEDKINELMIEKVEENRFDIICQQSKVIEEKGKEIIRLTELLNKNKEDKKDKKDTKNEKKILNVLESLECGINNSDDEIMEISVKKIDITTDKIESEDNFKDIYDKEAIQPDKEEDLIYGANASEIAADRMAAHLADKCLEKDPDEGITDSDEGITDSDEDKNKLPSEEGEEGEEGEEEEEDYEILNYRNKEYWIKVGEDPQSVYGVVGPDKDEVGDKIGIYKKAPNGRMKVFLDKK